MRGRLIALAVTALVLYGAAPALLKVLGAFNDLGRIRPWWWIAVILTQVAAIACFCQVQRIALHTRDWFTVATSNLASGALGRTIPGGAAAAAALQYQMLARGPISAAAAATALAAGSLLLLGTLAALPLLALPAVIGGLGIPRGLLNASLMGLAIFVALFAVSFVLMRSDSAVRSVGRAARWLLCRVRRSSPPPADLPDQLLRRRNEVLAALGERWPTAVAAATGRWLFDFLTLQAALAAVGAHPRISLALLAYAAAQLLAQVPITPGGLGIVEAGMTGTLALAGVDGGAAALATLAYRMGSYWLQLPAGLVAFVIHRRRYSAAVPAPG